MSGFQSFYMFLGGLGIFLLGMKYMSKSLKSSSGNFANHLLNILTKNRIMAILVGFTITSIIQSSSITTVMVIGLVNAGLMKLIQAIGVIVGANIGTTITGWIITIKISKYSLLFVGAGAFLLIFSKKIFWKNAGTVLISLGFVFLGLKFMSAAMAPLKDSPTFLFLMQYFTAHTILSVFACIGVATLLTLLIQSSSAMLGVIIALAQSGNITFATGVALILGANIGTTVTALLASINANATAKMAATAHTIFNLMGALLFLPVFFPFLSLVDNLVTGSSSAANHVALHIITAHSLFNLISACIFFPFIPFLARWLESKEKSGVPERSSATSPIPAGEAIFSTLPETDRKTYSYGLQTRDKGPSPRSSREKTPY